MVRLALLNGPPGVGKSTHARRYLDEHPLTLIIEIDGLRMAMGGWAEHEESKLQARVLTLALARTHLGTGHDVVIPQYLGRPEFIDQLQAVAAEIDATSTTSCSTTPTTPSCSASVHDALSSTPTSWVIRKPTLPLEM